MGQDANTTELGDHRMVTLMGQRMVDAVFCKGLADVSSAEGTGGWSEFIEVTSGGVKSFELRGVEKISGEGEHLFGIFLTGAARNMRVIIPSVAEIHGPFFISSCQSEPETRREEDCKYTLVIEPAGPFKFRIAASSYAW